MTFPKPRDVMRATLTLLLLFAFGGAMAALFMFTVPADNRDMLVYMLGQLSGYTGAGILYYLGSSKSSSDKTQLIASAPKKVQVENGPDDPVPTETVGGPL